MLTLKEVAGQTVLYAVGRWFVTRNEVLGHILEEAGTPIPGTFRGEKRNFQVFRQTITVTMNHLPGWKPVGAKSSPRWERIR